MVGGVLENVIRGGEEVAVCQVLTSSQDTRKPFKSFQQKDNNLIFFTHKYASGTCMGTESRK